MMGPGIPWYLAISSILFSIGVAGVLLRRSPLIVLLSLKIMLNAANLSFVGFCGSSARWTARSSRSR